MTLMPGMVLVLCAGSLALGILIGAVLGMRITSAMYEALGVEVPR